MYKVFINDKLLLLTNKLEKERNVKIYSLENVNIPNLINNFYNNKIDKAILYHPDIELLFKKFKSKLTIYNAGGGIVKNKENKTLFIYRCGKWDLPKGGVETNEQIQQTAIREVEEETGVTQLSIIEQLPTTYHIFRMGSKLILKITQWFAMHTNFDGQPKGQIEEGIEKVEWIDQNQLQEVLQNTYQNIKLLFQKTE